MEYTSILRNNKRTIAIITSVIVTLSLALSLLHPLEYSATSRLLVIQPTGPNVDAYGAIKSVERISEKLSEVIYTTSFYEKILESGFAIDQAYFDNSERKKRKQWGKMIDTRVLRGSGLIEVVIYHTSKSQAEEISKSIAYVFNASGWEYVGNLNIQIKEVDSPLISAWPVRPNFALNGLLGFILGFIVSIIYVLISSAKFKVSDIMSRAAKAIASVDGHGFSHKESIPEPYSDDELDLSLEEVITTNDKIAGLSQDHGSLPNPIGLDDKHNF